MVVSVLKEALRVEQLGAAGITGEDQRWYGTPALKGDWQQLQQVHQRRGLAGGPRIVLSPSSRCSNLGNSSSTHAFGTASTTPTWYSR